MGCLSRIGCLVVVAGAGAVGWWLYGDRLPSELSRAAGKAADKVSDVAGDINARSGTRPGKNSDSRSDARGDSVERRRPIAWASISPANGARAAEIIAPLTKRDGPAYLTLGAGDLAALLSASIASQLPKSATDLQLALDENELLLRAAVDVSEIAGDGTLGRVMGMALTGRDSLQFGGTLEPLSPGVVQYRVTSMRVKGFDVPPRFIPSLMGSVRRGKRLPGLADDAFAIRLPRVIADLRLANSKLTLYKAATTP